MDYRASASQKQAKKQWIPQVSDDFYDVMMSDAARSMAIMLEKYARNHAYCFPSNETLAKRLHKAPRTVQAILTELERLGWIHRVYATKRKRLGIVMLQRTAPGLPCAKSEAMIEVATAGLMERRSLKGKKKKQKEPAIESVITNAQTSAQEESEESKQEENVFLQADCSSSDFSIDAPEAPTACFPLDQESADLRAEFLEQAERLTQEPKPRRKAAVERFARLALEIVGDEDRNFGCHCGFGWDIALGKIPLAKVAECIDRLYLHTMRGEVDHPPGYYVAMMRKRRDDDLEAAIAEELELCGRPVVPVCLGEEEPF